MEKLAPIFLALATIADALFFMQPTPTGTPTVLEGKAATAIQTDLGKLNDNDAVKKAGIINVELAWGPVVYQAPDSDKADNVMFVTRNKVLPHDYTVAIAGTNFQSLFDWLAEDGTVYITSPWNGTKTAGKIAMGTRIGLEILKGLQSVPSDDHSPKVAMTLSEYLEQAVKRDRYAGIAVTGHSLGGALAPVMGLWLEEEKAKWSRKPKVYVYSFAGPTPGDDVFAAYYASKLKSRTLRIWNSLDVVPHAWSHTTSPALAEIPWLYEGLPEKNRVPAGEDLKQLAKALEVVGNKIPYSAINNAAGFRVESYADVSDCDSDLSKFLVQAIYQHINGYRAYYNPPTHDGGNPVVDCATIKTMSAGLKGKLEKKQQMQ